MRQRLTTAALCGALAVSVALPLWSTGAPAGARLRPRPPMPVTKGGKLEVIVNNLREWFPGDAPDDIYGNRPGTGPHSGCPDFSSLADWPRCGREMVNFARRMRHKLRYAPDIVLVEEAANRSLRLLARSMDRFIGHDYEVIKWPDPTYRTRRLQVGGKRYTYRIRSNTSIIINNDTMRVADPGGYIRVKQLPDDRLAGQGALIGQREAYALLQERRSRLSVAATAIHFATFPRFASSRAGKKRKAQWARRVTRRVAARYPDADLYLYGGEFNGGRCNAFRETLDCGTRGTSAFWNVLVQRRHLKDTVFAKHHASEQELNRVVLDRSGRPHRIDFIFSSDHLYSSTRDLSYSVRSYQETQSWWKSRRYISDHRWVQAVLGAPPTQTTIRHIELGPRVQAAGRIEPSPGRRVRIFGVLWKRKDGAWRKVKSRRSHARSGRFLVHFPRPPHARRCRVQVTFPGNHRYAESRDRKAFRC